MGLEIRFCACGCGFPIQNCSIKGKFVKKYKDGHAPKSIPNHHLCACGHCDKLVASDKTFIHGHNGVGENNGKCKNRKYPVPIPNHHLCECRKCGIFVASNRRFVSGHNGCIRKGSKLSKQHVESLTIAQNKPETRLKRSASIKASNAKPEVKERQRNSALIAGAKPEVKERRSIAQKKVTSRPGEKERRSELQKIAQNKPETKAKRSASQKIAQNKPETKEKRLASSKIAHNTVQAKENHSKAAKIAMNKPETKARVSEAKKANWQEPEYRESQLLAIAKGLNLKPNRPESLIDIITYEYWVGWKYTGDYSVIINGKNPDFVNEESKQIIEVYGDYWHDGEDPTDRAEIFAQAGYETCVIWESELNNLDHVILKLRRFMNGGINAWA